MSLHSWGSLDASSKFTPIDLARLLVKASHRHWGPLAPASTVWICAQQSAVGAVPVVTAGLQEMYEFTAGHCACAQYTIANTTTKATKLFAMIAIAKAAALLSSEESRNKNFETKRETTVED